MSRPFPTVAVVAMLVAVGLLAVMDAGLKALALKYPPMQVAFLRGAASLPFVVLWVAATGAFASLWRVRWSLHLLRGAIAVAMMAGFAYALKTLPLTTAYTIFFFAPLLITALSVPFLGEKVGPRRWAAIIVGFLGVLVVMRPSGEGLFSLPALAVLGAAAGYAFGAITVRILGRTDSTQSLVFWLVTLLTLGAGVLALPGWMAIASDDWLLIGGVGLAGALGQYALTEAFRRGEASVIAPLEYTALAWGVGFDLMIWGVLPDAMTWVGAAIIVASGLYLLHREKVRSADR